MFEQLSDRHSGNSKNMCIFWGYNVINHTNHQVPAANFKKVLSPFLQMSLPNLTRWLVVVVLPQAIFQSYVLGQADYNLSPVCFHASNNLPIHPILKYESCRICFTKIIFWYNLNQYLYWLFLSILILKQKSVWNRSKQTANFVKTSGFLDSGLGVWLDEQV